MKKFFVFLALLGALFCARLPAQEDVSLDWDLDSVFDESEPESPAGETETGEPETAAAESAIKSLIQQRGINFTASYEFIAGIAPGWKEPPWFPAEDHGFYLDRYIKLKSALSVDAQISGNFRVFSTISFEIPVFSLTLGDFFFDYSIADRIFIRGGKYALSWGISPNYGFTNLLSRVPNATYTGDSYIVKADIPSGIGGFQALALTRAPLMTAAPQLEKEDFGYGGKYNLALRFVDLDLGMFYQDGMALRSFLSVKTTLWKTELYSEGLFSIDTAEPSNTSGAVNLGFARDFFDGKFNVNGELFFNHERDVFWYRPKSNIRDAGTSPFTEGLDGTVNMTYKFGGKGDPRIFLQTRYALFENSAQLAPGFILTPWPNIEFYLAVPMALGSKDGYYYNNTYVTDTVEDKPVPFCVLLLVTLKGSVQFGYNY